MRLSRTRVATWILAGALPAEDIEPVIGDLEEEYASRSRSGSFPARWYWAQIVRSMPIFLWLSIRRAGWATLGVALGACALQAGIEVTIKLAVLTFGAGAPWPAALSLLVTLPSLTLLSYVATRMRPGAATAMAAVIVFVVLVQLSVKVGSGLPFGTQMAALVIGPTMAFTGGVLSLRTRRS